MREARTPSVPPATATAPRRRSEPGARTTDRQQPAGPVPHPAALAALQRTAGNAAVTRWVQRQEDTGAREEARRHAIDPTGHGEWGTFRDDMARAGFDDDVTDAAWQLILGGLAEQGQLNDEAMAAHVKRQDQRDHRASNTWYQDLVKLIGAYLKIKTPTLALWSGGRQMSDYALAKGHTPLESTAFGGVVDKLTLTEDWSLKTPMWNVLSKAFVNHAGGAVHIFLRGYDPDSVLIAQEIPQLRVVMALNPAVRLVWHPVYTAADGRPMEITKRLELTTDAHYATRDECVQVLYDYLRLEHDPANDHSRRAHAEMNARLAANGNAP
ncbi:hypothetical protein [Streptomyces subrutilus]|uniref:Uncharacterized protein n=1 Tax=Streptomyces subrutilus TaxID=36818 RepID=A0A5P2UTB1_9ACTN|nr:hypothetical protein [Streptomyces subrutilus]QEU81579.1 hypothetical protein CP968_27800 [Streptomyces subrutilus]WSJ29074.1 hypothetical protein OG479_06960 [Streptomyces subrutilus]GGZ93673.1 hypothetical protein GCM10010371_61840 [Streptomyces subrutilus]